MSIQWRQKFGVLLVQNVFTHRYGFSIMALYLQPKYFRKTLHFFQSIYFANKHANFFFLKFVCKFCNQSRRSVDIWELIMNSPSTLYAVMYIYMWNYLNFGLALSKRQKLGIFVIQNFSVWVHLVHPFNI